MDDSVRGGRTADELLNRWMLPEGEGISLLFSHLGRKGEIVV